MPFSQRGIARWKNRIGVLLAAVVATTAMLLVAGAARAEPSIQEKRRQAELILGQVQELDAEVGAAAERFNGAHYKLGLLTERLRQTRADLRRARMQLGTARGRASARLVQLYVNGSGPSTLEVVLGSATLSDMLDQLEVGRRILDQDTRIATDLKGLTRRTTQRERQAAASRATQAGLVRQLDSERNAIAAKLGERRQLLSSVQAEVTGSRQKTASGRSSCGAAPRRTSRGNTSWQPRSATARLTLPKRRHPPLRSPPPPTRRPTCRLRRRRRPLQLRPPMRAAALKSLPSRCDISASRTGGAEPRRPAASTAPA